MRQTLLALALLAAGGPVEGQASNSTVAPAASPSPVPRKAAPAPRPAGKGRAAPPVLKLELEQDGRAVAVQDHEALLQRAPFTLHVTLPDKDGVLVSVSFDPATYELASSGRPFGKREFRSGIAGAEGKANEGRDLYVGFPDDALLHYWNCDPGEYRRFEPLAPLGPGCRGQRRVENLLLGGEEVPLAKVLRRPLYVVVFRGQVGDEGPVKETGREWLKLHLGTAPGELQQDARRRLDSVTDTARPLLEREAALQSLAAQGREALLALDAAGYETGRRAREAAAVADLRAVIAAATAYAATNGGLFDGPPCLIEPAKCQPKYRGAPFLSLATLETRNGYKKLFLPGVPAARDEIKRAKATATSLRDFLVVAWPEVYGETGELAFCGDSAGRVCAAPGSGPPVKDGRCLPGCEPVP